MNPYLVLKSGGYTEHYYIEDQRIVSKLGGGWDNNGRGPLKAEGSGVDYAAKGQQLFDGIVKNLKFLGADGQILTAGKSGKVPPGQIKGTVNVTEAFSYFYHPDHLGSTSYVTDASGEVYQHLEYFAFGETFVEEHSNTNKTPYLFNGKELDEETGLNYYGARYYDPRTSIFVSVDPKAEDYASWSSYNYTFNNPLRFVDPDGKGPDDPPGEKSWYARASEWAGSILKGSDTGTNQRYQVEPKRGATVTGLRDTKAGRISNTTGKPVGDWVVRADQPHGNVKNPHINVNPKMSGVPDPHTPISGKTLKALEGAGKTMDALGKVAKPLAIATDAVRITDAVISDGGTIGSNTIKTSASVAGGWGGAWAGAVAGSFGGSWLGEKTADTIITK